MVTSLLCHKTLCHKNRVCTTRKSTSNRLLTERFSCLADQSFKRCRLMNGKVGQHFAINLNTGFAQPVDKPAIWQTMHARGGIDTLDPQSAKIAFARAPVAIGILPRFGDRLFGNTNGIFATAIITFGLGKNFLWRAWDVTPRFTRDIFAP